MKGAFVLLPVILQSFILFNMLHQLPYILKRPHCQQVSQFGVLGQSQLKNTCCDFFIAPADLVVQLLVPASVVVEGTFVLLPVILQSFILFDTPHQLPHILERPPYQRVSQFGVLRQSQSKSTHCDFFIAPADLIIQLPVSTSVAVEGFLSPHFHG